MNFSITRGNPSDQERAAIESVLKSRKSAPKSRRSKWGQPQLRSELRKPERHGIGGER